MIPVKRLKLMMPEMREGLLEWDLIHKFTGLPLASSKGSSAIGIEENAEYMSRYTEGACGNHLLITPIFFREIVNKVS